MSDGSSAKDAAWAALEAQAKADAGGRTAALFEAEPDRLQRLTLEAAGLFLDLSKHPWSRAGFDAALALARVGDVEAHRAWLFAGEIVNRTEKRPALHMALRAPDGAAYAAEGKPVSPEVEATRAQMQGFAEGVRAGRIAGATGKPYRTVVHIGIGGSDLGPKLVWEALKPLEPTDRPALRRQHRRRRDRCGACRPRSGADAGDRRLQDLHHRGDPGERQRRPRLAARPRWARRAPTSIWRRSAPTSQATASSASPTDRVFAFWDWVGGRYSLWSAVGLSTAIGAGLGRVRAAAGGRRGDGRALPHRRRWSATARRCWRWRTCSTATAWAGRSAPSCPTRGAWRCCRPSCSSWRWNRTASR